MKELILCFFALALLAGCTAESLEDYENKTIDKTKVERPGTQGIYMEEVDKDKVQRPGSQGDD